MDNMRQYREAIQKIYGKNDYWIVPIFRSLFSMFLLFSLNRYLGMTGKTGNPLVILVLGLLSFFLPFSFVPCLAGLYLLYYFYTKSLLLLGIGGLFFVLIFIIQSSVRGKYAILIAAMPLCFFLGIPYFLPLLVGLSMGLSAVLSLSLGILVYYFLQFIREYKEQLIFSGDLLDQFEGLSKKMAPLLHNKEMIGMLILFTLAALAIYIIRNFSFNYSWIIALITGICVEGLVFFVLPFLSVKMNIGLSLLSYLFSILFSAIALFFFRDADYRGTEFVQFEDDAYYYYVKAIPKNKA